MKRMLLLTALFSMAGNAGGKVSQPATIPVVPIVQKAVNPWYVGVGALYAKYKSYCDRGVSYEDITYGGLLRGGYEFNQYIGVEARYLRTFLDEGENGGEALEHYGLYLKPNYPVTERFNLYALLGYGHTESINDGGNGYLPEIKDDGLSWGIGVEYDLSSREDDFVENTLYERAFDGYGDQEKGWSLFIDYQNFWSDLDFFNAAVKKNGTVDSWAFSFGVTYDF